MNRGRLLLVMILCAGLPSCASHVGLIRPTVSLIDLDVAEVRALQTTLVLTLRIDNENPDPLYLEGSVHRLFLNDAQVGTGMINEGAQLPALGSLTQEVELGAGNIVGGLEIASMLQQGVFNYTLHSTLHLLQGNVRQSIEVSKAGVLDLRR